MPEPTPVPPTAVGPLLPSQRRHLETRKGELEASLCQAQSPVAALDTDIGRELELRAQAHARRTPGRAQRQTRWPGRGAGGHRAPAGGRATAQPGRACRRLACVRFHPRPVVARTSILFDEGHGQDRWFGIAPTIAKGYLRIATAIRQRMDVAYLPAGSRISAESLQAHNALVLALGPQGQTQLTDEEQQAIHEFVRNGGGLLVLGAYTGDWHHEGNLNQLLGEYGMAFNRDVVMQPGARVATESSRVRSGRPNRAMRSKFSRCQAGA